jgi:hypothetical protein
MRPAITRYLIPGAALLATFAVSLALVFAVAAVLDSGSGANNAATSPPTVEAPPTVAATRVAIAATPTASVTPTPTPTPEATTTPEPATPIATAEEQPAASLPPPASFAGTWRITDTVTLGAGMGQTFVFDVVLTQSGPSLQGGAEGVIALSGSVASNIATVAYTQPGLGVTGIFIWTLHADGDATGTFTSSVPNSGTSGLTRLQ